MSAQLKPATDWPVGIFTDVPAEQYHRREIGVANNTALGIIDERSPAHLLHWYTSDDEGDKEESASLAFGKAFHCAVLEPDVFDDLYMVLPADMPRDLRHLRNAKKPSDDTLRSIEAWDAWEEHARGRIILPAATLDLAKAMAASMRGMVMEFKGDAAPVEITVAELLEECETEVTLYWIDEETGIRCKARADLYARALRWAGDLKSVLDAAREAFAKAIFRHRYHVQHSHYCEGFRTLGEPLASFVFLPVEKEKPHVPASWHLGPVSEERGNEVRRRSMNKLLRCLETGRWPGHTTTVEEIHLPAFAFYHGDTEA